MRRAKEELKELREKTKCDEDGQTGSGQSKQKVLTATIPYLLWMALGTASVWRNRVTSVTTPSEAKTQVDGYTLK